MGTHRSMYTALIRAPNKPSLGMHSDVLAFSCYLCSLTPPPYTIPFYSIPSHSKPMGTEVHFFISFLPLALSKILGWWITWLATCFHTGSCLAYLALKMDAACSSETLFEVQPIIRHCIPEVNTHKYTVFF
jgi:hypothetical protein